MNVSAFARFLGLNQKTLDLYIKGDRKPSVELIFSVCSKCGVSSDWLLGLTDTRTPPVPHPIGATDYEKLAKEAAEQAEKDAAAIFGGEPKISVEESIPIGPPRVAGAFIARRKDGHPIRRYSIQVPQPPPIAGLTDDDLERLVSLVEARVLSRLRRESLHHRRKS